MRSCCEYPETKLRINREGYLVRVRIGTVNPLSASSQTHLRFASQCNDILPNSDESNTIHENQQVSTRIRWFSAVHLPIPEATLYA